MDNTQMTRKDLFRMGKQYSKRTPVMLQDDGSYHKDSRVPAVYRVFNDDYEGYSFEEVPEYKHTERTIQTIILDWCMGAKKHEMAIPNSRSVLPWEADVIGVTKSRLIHEFEIKISKADYKADKAKAYKHRVLSGKYESRILSPSYFWYVTHGFCPDPEIPEYAGWIEIVGNRMYMHKSAPRIGKIKISDKTMINGARLLSYRLSTMYDRHHSAKEK